MKKLIIICSMLAIACTAHAQASATNENAKESNEANNWSRHKQNDEFANTEMKFREGEVLFTDLPELPGKIWAIVTNSSGDFIKKAQISQQENTLSTSNLRNGSLYFITIMYHNKSKKAFTLNK